MDNLHSLLHRQMRRYVGGAAPASAELAGFIAAVNAAYNGFDDDRAMLERSLELSSNELVQANSEMRAVFQAIPDLLLRIDHQGTILDFKGGAAGDLLFASETLVGKRIQDIPIEGVRDRFSQAIRRVLSEQTVVGIEYSLPASRNGGCYEARLVPLLSDQIVVIVRNITARKRAEAIRDSQNRMLEMIATGAPLEDVLDKLVREVESQAPEMLCSILLLDPDGRRLRHGAAPSLPAEYNQFVDGHAIGPEAGACGAAAFRKEPVIVADILLDPLVTAHRDLALKHGLRACWSVPILSIHGKVLGTYAVYYRQPRSPEPGDLQLIDTASHIASIAIERAQVATALRIAGEQIRQSQKMEAFGQLAGGIAHDFNNLLTVIQGSASMFEIETLSEAEKLTAVEQISRAAERAANLTRQLLTFSRRQPFRPRAADLNQVMADTVQWLRRLIGEHIVLETRYAPGQALACVDPTMMEQVLLNLAVNARDAMPGGGQLVLRTDFTEVSAAPPPRHPLAQAGPYVKLSVTDTGCGIAPENLPRIFEPFYTTKDVGKGTGLGLATVFGIVEQHGGWIEVESEVGRGTSFCAFFPRLSGAEIAPPADRAVAPAPGGTETILLVEDEAIVRAMMQRLLARHGYRVVVADCGAAAIKLWEEQRHSIDLLITDAVMPGGISGQALARRLRSEQPSLQVILCSGYAADEGGTGAALEAACYFQKPFDQQGLLQKVRETLDRKTPQG